MRHTMSDKKTTYLIIGVVICVLAIPLLLVVLGMLGGAFYYLSGAK